MGAASTKNVSNNTESNLANFTVDIAKQTKTIINTVTNISKSAKANSNFSSNTTAAITISNSFIGGSLNITNTTISSSALIDLSVFVNSDLNDSIRDDLAQQFKDTLTNNTQNYLGSQTTNAMTGNTNTNIDSMPSFNLATTTSNNDNYKNIVDRYIDKSVATFKTNAATTLSNSIVNNINQAINNSSLITINNINVGDSINISAVTLTALSKVISNIIISQKMVTTFITSATSALDGAAKIDQINTDNSKVSSEDDIKTSTTTSIDGLIKGFQALFAMPVNLLAILVFGIVAVVAILGVVFVLTIKYLTSSPETLQLLGDIAKTAIQPGKGNESKNIMMKSIKTDTNTPITSIAPINEKSISEHYINEIDKLLSRSHLVLETSLY